MGGSFKLLFIAISKNYNYVHVLSVWTLFLVQEAKEILELAEIKNLSIFCCSQKWQYD